MINIKPLLGWLARQLTFTKIAIALLIYKSVGWVDQSYALAWAGKAEIAEALSKVVVTEIIGVFFVYAMKALFETLSKNNNWPDKPVKKNESEDSV